ncbi:MAG: tRNA pseudouridine(38-40) synthase TruA [Chloroflexi bacterium]|nr:MAG: tRNA pseudouridine(38-40) synthase TruA [Chloroflexota bacterium]
MLRFRATLAYDGSAYQGFQRQAEGIPTVQWAVECAICKITKQDVTLLAAGRTDTGVHAVGQVITFDVEWRHDPAVLLRALNAVLPDDIALQDIQRQDGFHPRYDAVSRRYCYTVIHAPQRHPLWHKRAWYVHQPLNHNVMQQTAAAFVGQHDFAAFGNPPQGSNTIRQVFASSWRYEQQEQIQIYRYTVEATAFLHHMVRRMVGIQVEVGRGALDFSQFMMIFQSADLARNQFIAPPQGLVLEKVRYSDDNE